ncbi:unnamed protein product [Calypogeia fissa]
MLEANPTAGLGEAGLDLGTRGREIDETLQVDILREQLNLGRDLQRPVSIHCVRAIGPLQGLLSKMGTFPSGLIMHSFNGPAEAVKGLVKHGAYFSFSGFFTPIKASKAKKVLQQVPLDRILLETDAPDALPEVGLRALMWVPEDESAPSLGHGNGSDNLCCCSDGNNTHSQEKKKPSTKGALNHPANIRACEFQRSCLLKPLKMQCEFSPFLAPSYCHGLNMINFCTNFDTNKDPSLNMGFRFGQYVLVQASSCGCQLYSQFS